MSSDDNERLSEEIATRLWERAAELQAEASRRSERASRVAAESDLSEPDQTGYALAHVRQAAEEAGISGEFIDAALAEVQAQTVIGLHKESFLDRVATRMLGQTPEFVEVRRVIPATPDVIYETMQRMLPAGPFNLSLRDVQGDILDGGVMVFDVTSIMSMQFTTFEYEMSYPGIKQIMVSIHPVDGGSCEVVLRGSLRSGRRLSAGLFGTISGAAGVGGVAGGLGVGMALGTGLGLGMVGLLPLAVGTALLGGGALGGASRGLFRKLYVYSVGRGTRALEGLLGSLHVSIVSDWGGGGRSSGAAESPTPGLLGDPAK